MREYVVYMITNWNNKVLYIGVTNDIHRRMEEHKNSTLPGFSAKYNLTKLVYYEFTDDIQCAIAREKELKGWRRARKDALVNAANPDWHDLMDDLFG